MPSARQSVVVQASPAALREVIIDFKRYAEFLSSVQEATVLRGSPNQGSEWTVAFRVGVIRELTYTLRLWEEEPAHSPLVARPSPARGGATVIQWSLIEGRLFKAIEGSWCLKPLIGPSGEVWTTATYQIQVDLEVFLPGPLLSLLTDSSLPQTLAAFKLRAERPISNA